MNKNVFTNTIFLFLVFTMFCYCQDNILLSSNQKFSNNTKALSFSYKNDYSDYENSFSSIKAFKTNMENLQQKIITNIENKGLSHEKMKKIIYFHQLFSNRQFPFLILLGISLLILFIIVVSKNNQKHNLNNSNNSKNFITKYQKINKEDFLYVQDQTSEFASSHSHVELKNRRIMMPDVLKYALPAQTTKRNMDFTPILDAEARKAIEKPSFHDFSFCEDNNFIFGNTKGSTLNETFDLDERQEYADIITSLICDQK